jgi:hypothetical protein
MQGRGCQYYRHHNVVLQMAVLKKISCLTNVALKWGVSELLCKRGGHQLTEMRSPN